jgi:hypothetical protein
MVVKRRSNSKTVKQQDLEEIVKARGPSTKWLEDMMKEYLAPPPAPLEESIEKESISDSNEISSNPPVDLTCAKFGCKRKGKIECLHRYCHIQTTLSL